MGFIKKPTVPAKRKVQTRFACFESRKFCPICGSHRASEVTNDACSVSVEKTGGKSIIFRYKYAVFPKVF